MIAAALELLNEVGMDSSDDARKLERQVQQPALYWHFQNKRKRCFRCVRRGDAGERHTRSLPEENEDWRVFLKENALSFRTALLSYRDGARIHAGTRPTEPILAPPRRKYASARRFCPKRAVWRSGRSVTMWSVPFSSSRHLMPMREFRTGQMRPSKHRRPSCTICFHELETDGMDAAFNFDSTALIAGFERLRSSTTD